MRKRVNADLKRFYCEISFIIECSNSDFEKVKQHYRDLCSFYNIEGTFSQKSLMSDEFQFEHFWFSVILTKSEKNYHLSTVALRNVFLNDLEIIRQLHYVNDVEFQCPRLNEKIF